jgi:hypothetical protein
VSIQKTPLKLTLAIFMLAFAATANAAEAYIDYDHSADFSTIKTFQMADSSNGALAKQNQLLDQQVHQMIAQHLTGLGLQEVTENPDQVISYDASTKENHQLNTIPMGVGFGLGWRRFGGMGMATTTETTFTEGTLVIDSYTPSGKQMLWRGISESSVSENPQKTEKNIGRSLDELFEKLAKVITP